MGVTMEQIAALPGWAHILIAAVIFGITHWFSGVATKPRAISASSQCAIGFFCGLLYLLLVGVLR